MQAEQVIGIGPDPSANIAGACRQLDKLFYAVFIGTFGKDGLIGCETKSLIADADRLLLLADQVHFNAPEPIIIKCMMGKLFRFDLCIQFPLDTV